MLTPAKCQVSVSFDSVCAIQDGTNHTNASKLVFIKVEKIDCGANPKSDSPPEVLKQTLCLINFIKSARNLVLFIPPEASWGFNMEFIIGPSQCCPNTLGFEERKLPHISTWVI